MLGSEYGWTKDYVLNSVYPDDLILLGEEITKRLIDKTLMDLRISTNPHMEPAKAKEFLEELLSRRRSLWGPTVSDAPLDKEALLKIKEQFKNSSSSIKAK